MGIPRVAPEHMELWLAKDTPESRPAHSLELGPVVAMPYCTRRVAGVSAESKLNGDPANTRSQHHGRFETVLQRELVSADPAGYGRSALNAIRPETPVPPS